MINKLRKKKIATTFRDLDTFHLCLLYESLMDELYSRTDFVNDTDLLLTYNITKKILDLRGVKYV